MFSNDSNNSTQPNRMTMKIKLALSATTVAVIAFAMTSGASSTTTTVASSVAPAAVVSTAAPVTATDALIASVATEAPVAPAVDLSIVPPTVEPTTDKAVNTIPEDFVGGGATAVTASASQTWALDRLDQPLLPLDSKFTYNEDGTGTKVYVIDSGVRATNVEFTGKVLPGIATVGGNIAPDFSDCNGHGTHVAGLIAGSSWGTAKGTKIVPVHALGCDGLDAGWKGTIAGLNWITANYDAKSGPAVINMSLGGSASTTLEAAMAKAQAKGIIIVVAAGNDNKDACLSSPARYPSAITVGASASNDKRASFSNFGKCVDVFAPGVGIKSAGNTQDTGVAIMSGTSMASPQVAGIVAQMLQRNPKLTQAQVAAALIGESSAVVTDAQGFAGLAQVDAVAEVAPAPTTTTTTAAPITTTTVSFASPTTAAPTTTTTKVPVTTTTAAPVTTTTAAPVTTTTAAPKAAAPPTTAAPVTTTTTAPYNGCKLGAGQNVYQGGIYQTSTGKFLGYVTCTTLNRGENLYQGQVFKTTSGQFLRYATL